MSSTASARRFPFSRRSSPSRISPTAPTTSAGSKISWRGGAPRRGSVSRPRSEHGDLITPSLLLRAYACGIFPMADSADDPTLYWVEPRLRGVLPLEQFHVPRRLARTVRSGRFDIRVDTDFEGVIAG